MKCPYCGNDVASKFCNNCGAQMPEEAPVNNTNYAPDFITPNNFSGPNNGNFQSPAGNGQFPSQPAPATNTKKPVYKKPWFWIVIGVVLLIAVAAFAGGGSEDSDSNPSAEASDTTVAESEETKSDDGEAEADDKKAEDDKTEADDTTKAAETTTVAAAKGYTIADQVIYDDEICKFTITSVEDDSIWGVTINVLCENKTEDTKLTFSWDSVSVLGYMVDAVMYEEVAPGKKATSEVTLGSTKLSESNISSVDELEFTLKVYDADDWSADDFVKDSFTVYPTGLDKNTVVYPERVSVKNETVIVDNDDLTFIIESVENDDIWGYTLNCYIENKTDKTVIFTWDDTSVNGFMMDPLFSTTVAANKSEKSEVSFGTSNFEDNNITDVESVEFTLRAYDSDDWLADYILEDTYTYNP